MRAKEHYLMNGEIEAIKERLADLEQQCARSDADCRQLGARCERLDEENERRRGDYRRLTGRLRVVCGLGLATLAVALFASPTTRAVAQSGYGATIQALIDKTQYITVAGGEMYIRNTNLHIENGLGATNGRPDDIFQGVDPITNGKGNLIVGYDEGAAFGGRTGSHNLVVGAWNSYTSAGGLVAGWFNGIGAPYATVTGGVLNGAVGSASSVSGGFGITRSTYHGWAAGGENPSFGGPTPYSGVFHDP
jgi:hypothetical protein